MKYPTENTVEEQYRSENPVPKNPEKKLKIHGKHVVAHQIVTAIISDLKDRSGLGNEWDAIDTDTRDEIKKTWQSLAEDLL